MQFLAGIMRINPIQFSANYKPTLQRLVDELKYRCIVMATIQQMANRQIAHMGFEGRIDPHQLVTLELVGTYTNPSDDSVVVIGGRIGCRLQQMQTFIYVANEGAIKSIKSIN